MPNSSYDVIILGAGSMGLMAGLYLARRGQSVLLLDTCEPPHSFGSHHGGTRLLRVAYGEGTAYVPLALRARQLWLELEAEHRHWLSESPAHISSQPETATLFAPIGVLNVMPRHSSALREIENSVRTHDLPGATLDAEEAMRRWPGLALSSDMLAHFDPLGGVLFNERALLAGKRLALAAGADARFEGHLDALHLHHDGVSMVWSGAALSAKQLLISAGAGSAALLQRFIPDWAVPLQPTRKVFAWYHPADDEHASRYTAPSFPGFSFETDAGWFYGFPDFGEGVKVGRHDGGTPCTPATVDRTFHAGGAEDEELQTFLRRFLPGAAGPLREGKVCMYTMTPDEHFVIDRHPTHPHVFLATGFSGHGFKFASAVGEALAMWLCQETPLVDLSPFSARRFSRT
ncbi:N-methyl-L-tryptophan oxidase [Alicyclobacillus contaminans]|uniref:N-methyl-L-tryptophan oxidase n=1 Tax=Alicyclobacillus contaminans TaxID=392016 RepID=UPI0004010F3B|nr:N-methyl-L-tryptophan oxidase [Alicyclobacillus contaminans]GMA50637.1 N-methyl-L-tryptophan oxidase [Alicyclobacillus contaminans]